MRSANLKKKKLKRQNDLSFSSTDNRNKKSNTKNEKDLSFISTDSRNKKSNIKKEKDLSYSSTDRRNKKSKTKKERAVSFKPIDTEDNDSYTTKERAVSFEPIDSEVKKKSNLKKKEKSSPSERTDSQKKKSNLKKKDRSSSSKRTDSQNKKSNLKKEKPLSSKPSDTQKKSNAKKKFDKKETQIYQNNTTMFTKAEEKEGYCVNKYDNGDAYFGYYANDLRNQNGFYFYHPTYVNNYKLNRYYLGFWKDDLRQGYGIYLWAKERKKEKFYNNFENSNFIVYVGYFISDHLTKGTYLSKENDDYFVYHGTFSKDLKREGKNCFYYNSNSEILMYGTFKANEFVDGYFANFDDDGNMKEIFRFKKNKIELFDKNQENEKIKEIMKAFRNCIMAKDYFGIIYKVFSSVAKTKDTYLFDIDIVNTYKNEEYMNMCVAYKKITIFHDIEKYVTKSFKLN